MIAELTGDRVRQVFPKWARKKGKRGSEGARYPEMDAAGGWLCHSRGAPSVGRGVGGPMAMSARRPRKQGEIRSWTLHSLKGWRNDPFLTQSSEE